MAKFCISCAATNPDTAKKCVRCGKLLQGNVVSNLSDYIDDSNEEKSNNYVTKGKGIGKKIFLILGLAALILVILAVMGWHSFLRKCIKDSKPDEELLRSEIQNHFESYYYNSQKNTSYVDTLEIINEKQIVEGKKEIICEAILKDANFQRTLSVVINTENPSIIGDSRDYKKIMNDWVIQSVRASGKEKVQPVHILENDIRNAIKQSVTTDIKTDKIDTYIDNSSGADLSYACTIDQKRKYMGFEGDIIVKGWYSMETNIENLLYDFEGDIPDDIERICLFDYEVITDGIKISLDLDGNYTCNKDDSGQIGNTDIFAWNEVCTAYHLELELQEDNAVKWKEVFDTKYKYYQGLDEHIGKKQHTLDGISVVSEDTGVGENEKVSFSCWLDSDCRICIFSDQIYYSGGRMIELEQE